MIFESAHDKKGNRFWKTITEPSSYPITVLELKEFARIDGNEEDTFLESIIVAVTNLTENYLSRALITRTIKMIMDEWNSNEIEIPMPPLVSITNIVTVDEDEVETIYNSDNYYVITESIPGRVIIRSESTPPSNTERYYGGYRITYQAGYGTAENIPKEIKMAMLQWSTMIYEHRSMTDNEMIMNEPPPQEVRKILKSYRVMRI
jgi:uncharacterized phiE125 gp8 family phage protein